MDEDEVSNNDSTSGDSSSDGSSSEGSEDDAAEARSDLETVLALFTLLRGAPRHGWLCAADYSKVFLLQLSDNQVEHRMRFQSAAEVQRLGRALRFADYIKTPSRCVFRRNEAMMLLCHRAARPGRLDDMVERYGITASAISELCTEMVHQLSERFYVQMQDLRRWVLWVPVWQDQVEDCGAQAEGTHSFFDCKLMGTCKPGMMQRQAYSGYYRHHAMKGLALTAPAGISIFLFGIVAGRRADPHVLDISGMKQRLAALHALLPPAHLPAYSYGDAAFEPTSVTHPTSGLQLGGIMAPFKGAGVTVAQERYNQSNSKPRTVAAELNFGLVSAKWGYLEERRAMKVPAKSMMPAPENCPSITRGQSTCMTVL